MLILGLQAKFSEALRQVRKQQIKVKFWIWGPITVNYNKTFAKNIFFQESLHPNPRDPYLRVMQLVPEGNVDPVVFWLAFCFHLFSQNKVTVPMLTPQDGAQVMFTKVARTSTTQLKISLQRNPSCGLHVQYTISLVT